MTPVSLGLIILFSDTKMSFYSDGTKQFKTLRLKAYTVMKWRQGVMGTNWGTGSSVWTWGGTSSLWGWRSTGTGCPGRLWSLLLWRYSRSAWTRSCADCCRWPCFGGGVGLDDPQRSLPTPTILWFCDSVILWTLVFSPNLLTPIKIFLVAGAVRIQNSLADRKKEVMLCLSCRTCAAVKPVRQQLYGQGESKFWTPDLPHPIWAPPSVGYCPPSSVILPHICQPTNSFGQTFHLRRDLVTAELFSQSKAKTTKLMDWPNTVLTR